MYRDAVKSFGISESTFGILYAIRNSSVGLTQREIIQHNFLPPQTINSALKKMEADLDMFFMDFDIFSSQVADENADAENAEENSGTKITYKGLLGY